MKLPPWVRLSLLVVTAVSIAMTAAISDGGATVKTAEPVLKHAKAARHGMASTESTQMLRVELERMARPESGVPQAAEADGGGIFSVTSWYVPPPPPPPQPPPPPPKPTAPPMPFSYLGRYQEAQAEIILLIKGDRLYTVAAGEVLDNIYRVDGVVGGRIELTYLPLNIKQTIDTGEAS